MTLLTLDQFIEQTRIHFPIGYKIKNLGRGNTIIENYNDNKICYRRKNSNIYIELLSLYDAYVDFSGKKVSSTDLRQYAPKIFNSKKDGHSCNCTFFFQILKEIGVVNKIMGEGKRGNPFYIILDD